MFKYILVLLVLFSSALAAATGPTKDPIRFDRPAVKDSTILRSTVSCPYCPDRNCYKCTLGHNKTLEANTGGLAYVRALIGFEMPVAGSDVTSCLLQIPAFTKPLEYPITVQIFKAQSDGWNEDSADGENAPEAGDLVATMDVPAHFNMGPTAITSACQAAPANGRFSIYIATKFGHIEFPSKDSGNPAIIHVIA